MVAMRIGVRTQARCQRQFQIMTTLPTVAFNTRPTADNRAGECSFSLPVQALLSCVGFQSQYQAFVRCCDPRKRRSLLLAIALNRFCVLEPFTRRALASRELAFLRTTTGPAPMSCPERSRSRAIFQVVFG